MALKNQIIPGAHISGIPLLLSVSPRPKFLSWDPPSKSKGLTPSPPVVRKTGPHPPTAARTRPLLPVDSRRSGYHGTQTRRGGGFPSISMTGGYPPTQKKEEGGPSPPLFQKTGSHPPFGYMHAGAVSHGVTTEKGILFWLFRKGGGGPSCARRGTHPPCQKR